MRNTVAKKLRRIAKTKQDYKTLKKMYTEKKIRFAEQPAA